jgi:uncharacterized membrane protein
MANTRSTTGDASASVDVRAPIDWAYASFIEFTKFPLNDVDPAARSEQGFRWKANGVLGSDAEFHARITQHEPNQLIAWHAEGQPEVRIDGVARFQELSPSDTRVEVHLKYEAPVEAAPEASGAVPVEPAEALRVDLRRYKQQLESASPEDFTQTSPAESGDAARTPLGVDKPREAEGSPRDREAVTDDISRAAGIEERDLRDQGLRPNAS